MTQMPQLVAIFNGFGGGASALVASSEFLKIQPVNSETSTFLIISIVLSVLIGTLTFTGSFPWIFLYIYFGNILGENYLVVQEYIKPIEIPLLLILLCVIIFFFCYKFYKIRKKT